MVVNLFYVFIASYFIISCGDKITHTSSINGQIKSLEIDYVISKRDWCRFSKIVIWIEVENKSNDSVLISSNGNISWCNQSVQDTSLFLRVEENHDKEKLDIRDFSLGILNLSKDKQLLPNEKIELLEVGCGTGVLALLLKDKLKSYTGLDISEKAVKNAEHNLKQLEVPTFFTISDVFDGLPEKKFDILSQVSLIASS